MTVTSKNSLTPGDISFLRTIDIFSDIDVGQFDSLIEHAVFVALKKGRVLFKQGDPGDAIFIVKDGEMTATITRVDGTRHQVSKIKPGQTIGEMQILFDGKRTADIHADTDARLIKIPKTAFKACAQCSPALMNRITQTIRRRFRRDQLASILPTLFGPLDETTFSEIESMIDWIHVAMGEALFLQGEISDSFYIVISGYLHAIAEDTGGYSKKILNKITRGECIGEMGLISGEKRSASVYAARNSVLARFSQPAFDKITRLYPEVMRYISRILIKRLQNRSKPSRAATTVKNIAIIPAGKPAPISRFASRLTGKLSHHGPVLHISSQRLDGLLGTSGISQVAEDAPHSLNVSAWLDEQEMRHHFIVYETDLNVSPWTERAVRNADVIILVAHPEMDPAPNEIEQRCLCRPLSFSTIRRSMVLIHPSGGQAPEQTSRWFVGRRIDNHHHIRVDADADYERLARFVANKAIGIVLGGGGARGFAHIGILQALRESKIPIDMIGGTSMGAIISAQYAMGWEQGLMLEENKNAWLKSRPLKDYTLPVYSVIKGKRINKMSRTAYGEKNIEDLWVNFFCVSSNLTKAEPLVHRRGALWKAVRASSSLPGMLQPWVHNSDMLVDGAILNNLPGDIMRELCEGFVVLADVSAGEGFAVDRKQIPSPWAVAWKKIVPFSASLNIPTLLDVLIRSTVVGSARKAEIVKRDADIYFKPPVNGFGLLEFQAINDIADAGYRYAKKEIQRLKETGVLDKMLLTRP